MKKNLLQHTSHGLHESPWFIRSPARLAKDKKQIGKEFPHLKFKIEETKVYLEGQIAIYDAEGNKEIDIYSIRIDFPDNYPDEIPKAFETDGKIIRTADWHVIPSDGSLCVFLPEEAHMDLVKQHSIIDFLDAVYGFLVQHYIKIHTGEYPQGEWAHGGEGLIEFYREQLRVTEDKILIRFLYHLIAPSKGRIPVNALCPCDSRKKFKKCHRQNLAILVGKTTERHIQVASKILLDKIEIKKS